MQPRSEPLLWLQCLALGAIPLELLLIRLVLAGADPGPVPGVERFLIVGGWGPGPSRRVVATARRLGDLCCSCVSRWPAATAINSASVHPKAVEQPRRCGDRRSDPAARPLVDGRFSGAGE